MIKRSQRPSSHSTAPQVQAPPWPLAGFALGISEFKSSTMLVKSQLVCLQPVLYPINPFTPELPVTARVYPRPFYPLRRHQF